MQRRSTTVALLAVVNDINKSFESKQPVCAVFFDLKKAFDSVPHRCLLEKLQKIGLNDYLLRWIFNYLHGRFQCVRVNGSTSAKSFVISGVPQGSVLGPLLFNIYVNGIFDLNLANDAILSLFADDIILYKPITSHQDFSLLQDDINAIFQWSVQQHLTFNIAKCKYMIFSSLNRDGVLVPTALCLNDSPLELGSLV